MQKPHILSGGRYPVLRALGILYLLGAVLAAVAGIVAAIWVVAQLGDLGVGQRLMLALSTLGGAFFVVISMLAIAEGIKLFIDMADSLRIMRGTAIVSGSGAATGDGGRIGTLDEETAEAALFRGH